MIQNLKNIKSKFRIDLKYFSQHLVNTKRFNESLIWEKVQKKSTFSKIKNFQTLLNQNLYVFSMNNVFSGVLQQLEWCFSVITDKIIFRKKT